MSPPVSAWLSLASSSAICGRSLSSPSLCRPIRAWSGSVPVRLGSLPCFHPFLRRLLRPFNGAWSRRVACSFQLKVYQHLSDVSLVRLDGHAVTIPFNDTIQYSSALLKVCVFPNHLLLFLPLLFCSFFFLSFLCSIFIVVLRFSFFSSFFSPFFLFPCSSSLLPLPLFASSLFLTPFSSSPLLPNLFPTVAVRHSSQEGPLQNPLQGSHNGCWLLSCLRQQSSTPRAEKMSEEGTDLK